jgi:hypothetical protein
MNYAIEQLEVVSLEVEPSNEESPLLAPDQLSLIAGGQCITNSI